MAPQLLTTDSMESDNDDSHDNENSLAEETVENDDTKAFPVEKKVLHFDEDSEVAQEETTQEDFHKDVLEPKQLPEQVAICAENILENPESAKQMENDLFLHTMDFAGQPVYSVTHPVFLPPKGIFLLVHNLENDLHAQATPMVKCGAVELTVDDHCPMTNMDHLEFWLSLVAANSTLEGGSPVFVVSTHADKFSTPNAETIARKILLYLKRDDFSPGNHVVRGIHIVDNTISGSKGPNDPGVQNLKVAISNKARSLPQFDEDIPIRWLLFEKSLMNVVKEEQKKYISREDAKSIALQCEVEVESDEFRTLLEYLHDLKVIIYFPETNMIIIDTQWLLDMFAKVITVLPIECHEGYEHEWEKLEDQGIVDETFLKYLWKDDSTPVQSLITIMEKFSLICKQQDGSYLVPAMLLNAPECHELMNTDEMASSLVIRFKSSHLPFGVFPRLFAAVHKLCSSRWPDSTAPSLSRNFARFYIADDAFSLVLISDVQTITVALVNEETPGSQDDYLCSFLLKFLRETLPEMMESFPWMKSLEFEFECHELMNTDEMASSLVIRFKSSHLPFGVFPRLFAAVHKLCSSRWPDSTAPSLSRNFARFYIANDAFSLVLISDVQTITVALVNEETPGSQDDYLCSFLLKFLRKTLPEMMESFPWMKSLEFEFGIHCPICEDAVPCTKHNKMACSRDSCAHFIPEKELLKKTKPRCHKNPTKRNVIPPSSFSLWFRCNNSAEVKESQEQIQEICSCSCSTEDDQEVCQEVIAAFNQISLKTISQDEVTRTAKRIADTFNLDKNDTATPPKDITQKCRASCKWLIAQGGEVFVEALRNELPSGMTGPLRVGYDVKVCDMDSMTKTQFSQALTAKEMEWKAFAKEKVGLSSDEIEFLDKRKSNPVLEILNEHCHDWSVEQLYDAVVSVGADAIADRYL
ncbi:putative serine/threonine-protein kinase pats1 [Exaiptasia diaphana]|nr:putative serine/threonine-protein kinase pats1 [Exaiptasia diaphana]